MIVAISLDLSVLNGSLLSRFKGSVLRWKNQGIGSSFWLSAAGDLVIGESSTPLHSRAISLLTHICSVSGVPFQVKHIKMEDLLKCASIL